MKLNVLVLGDWVVDEHWVTSVHRSTTRSRAGRQHSRVLHRPDSWIVTLAGAGKTAELLCRSGDFEVRGIGVWDHKDEGALVSLLALPPTQFHHFNFDTLTGSVEQEKLLNLGGPDSITTRVIRVWQQQGSRYEIVNRIDWEAEKTGVVETYNDRLNMMDSCDAIVLKDMAKGVVTSPIVQRLQKGKAGHWFVSSKLWRPEWYNTLASKEHRSKVRLFLVPQVAAAAAYRSDISRWFTDLDLVSPEGVEAIQQFREDFPNAVICILPRALSLIALVKVGNTDRLFTFLHEPTEQYQTEMPMASVFLPTITAALLKCWPDNEYEVKGRLTEVLRFVDNWMHHQFERITSPLKWLASEERSLVVSETMLAAREAHRGRSLDVRIQIAPWSATRSEWVQAHSNRGVICEHIETRRAAIEVDGYVCLVKQKREVLRRLLAEVRSFQPDSGMSKSFMLLASPGSGKSYLVKRLADMEDLELLAFNITSLQSRLDLLDCFDTIVTNQTAKREKRFLVFFDEIDAYLDGQPVYDAFLRPLEEGLYIRAGKAFYVGPCIWMFCGTRSPVEMASDAYSERAKKGSDFLSRLTLGLQNFHYDPTDSGVEELARLENVYAGVAVLKRAFPDVSHVSEAVLEAFRRLPPKTGIRDIERFVKRFSQIQYGKVTAQNLQDIRWKEEFHISDQAYKDWERLKERLAETFIFIDPKAEITSASTNR